MVSKTNLSTADDSKVSPSFTKSYSALFSDPESYDPGPGQYDLPAGFGYQAESHKETMAVKTMAPKNQEGWSKVLISKAHLAELFARETPGPGSYTPGHVKTRASIRIGTSLRPTPTYGDNSPGPVYDIRGGPGDLNHNIKFGRDGRFQSEQLDSLVGPGQYPQLTQFDGCKYAKSFGISHRAYDKVHLPGSERQFRGRTSPGPINFKPFVAGGRNYSFPKSTRPEMRADCNPVGPGAYGTAEGGKKSVSSYSFGKPSCAARFNWGALKIQSQRWCKLGMACGRQRAASMPP
eukprot:GEMP01029288.1.p1 GENE.GEMP01029288.1~~GEMP01029288.1.p1  ORF type:complete len:307 (+),score=23.37 GEMP01029288.1:48-923(+)